MRLTRAIAAGVLLALAIAGCGSGGGPGWTYAPAPSATPVPSGVPSGSPVVSGSPAVSPSGPGGATVTVVATTAAQFDTPELEVAADEPFTLVFDNRDPTVQHNVVIRNPDGSKVEMGDTSFFLGPETRTYQVPALAAGAYPFICEVHPTTMTGTLTAR
jgi:plastocyanin